jgi:hypothetical protein
MAGTLSTFSATVLCGLELFGIKGSKVECNGYQHLWKYVGYYLGKKHWIFTEDCLYRN